MLKSEGSKEFCDIFAYKSAFHDKFVMFKVDLQAGCDDIRLTNPDNEIMHHIKLCDGIDETIWNNYGGTVILSFNELICIIQSVMSSFPKKFDVLEANCIQFKNMVMLLFLVDHTIILKMEL